MSFRNIEGKGVFLAKRVLKCGGVFMQEVSTVV